MIQSSMTNNNGAFINLPETDKCFETNVNYTQVTAKMLAQEIAKINNPQVIFWYIGAYGLREDGVKYYRKDLTKLLGSSATCQLYDLTAWAPFSSKESDNSIQSFNQNADLINQFAIPQIQCIKSCDFFNWLIRSKEIEKKELQKILQKRSFIYRASESYTDNQRTIGEIFKWQCPPLADLYEQKSSKCYSAIQYMEGIYLVKSLTKKALEKDPDSKEINLVFALPNDEDRYYRDQDNSFAEDIKALLQEDFGNQLKNKKVNVTFLTFGYTNQPSSRPYNAGLQNIEKLEPAQMVDLSKAIKI